MTSIDFQAIKNVDRKEWEQFTSQAVDPYYINQEYEYAKIMESGGISPIYFLSIRDSTGKINSGIVLYSSKTIFGEILTSNGGPVVIDHQSQLLKEGLQHFIKEYKHRMLNIRLAFIPPSNHLSGTNILKSLRPAMTSIVNLNESTDEVWKKIKKTRQRHIKSAINSKIEVHKLSTWDQWKSSFDILVNHSNEKGYPLNLNIHMWKLIFEKYFSNGVGKKIVFGAFYEDKLVGVIVFTTIGGRSTMDILGELPTENNYDCSSLLVWKAIEYSKNNNCQSFNLSGLPPVESNLKGIRIFKESFGGVELPIEEYCTNSAFSIAFNSLRHPNVSNLVNKSFHLMGLENLFWKIKSPSAGMPLIKKNEQTIDKML